MKWLLATCVCLMGCTIDIRPLESKKKSAAVHRHVVSKKPIKSASHQIIVDDHWMERYRQMEAEHGGYEIPEDDNIKAYGANYVIPKSVQEHYDDLAKVSPTPHSQN